MSTALEPDNATVEPSMPEDLSDGIKLHGLDGITVTPAGADQADPRQLVGPDKLFYGGVGPDTDFIASSTSTGMEAFWQLRSADSPLSQSLHLDLPQGASIEGDGAGGATISDGQGPIAEVPPPTALDADGTAVPVHMRVSGTDLELDVGLDSGDYSFPILVDPVIEDYDWASGASCPSQGTPSATYWHWETSNTSSWGAGCNSATTSGLLNQARASQLFLANAYAQWVWRPPAGTYISAATYDGVRHVASGGSCATFGIYQNGDPGVWQAYNGGGGMPNRCASFGPLDKTFSLSGTQPDGNLGVIQLLMPNAVVTTAAASEWVPEASFTLGDSHDPTITSHPTPTGTWADDGTNANPATLSQTISADDVGTGIKQIWMFKPKTSDPSQLDADLSGVRSCSASPSPYVCTNPTSWSKSFNYTLPEGRNVVSFMALDGYNNVREYDYERLVDRTAPTISLSGSLKDQADNIVTSQSYDLAVSASDGSDSSDATMGSGVASIQATLDGASAPLLSKSQPCTTAKGGCPETLAGSLHFDLDSDDADGLTPGLHTVHVTATDALGHTRTSDLSVRVRAESDPPQLTLTPHNPNANGTWTLEVSATDAGATVPNGSLQAVSGYASGMGTIDVIADGQTFTPHTQSVADCTQGACSFTTSFQMPADTSWSGSDIAVAATDLAGNAAIATNSKPSQKYDSFGFNDNFSKSGNADTYFQEATASNASIIRFPLDWCGVVGTGSRDPATWSGWGGMNELASDVAAYNRGLSASAKPMEILPVLVNSPDWARVGWGDTGKPADCYSSERHKDRPQFWAAYPPDAPDATHPGSTMDKADWQTFVGQVLQKYGPTARPNAHLVGLEVWNEENWDNNWGAKTPSPQGFSDLVGTLALQGLSQLAEGGVGSVWCV